MNKFLKIPKSIHSQITLKLMQRNDYPSSFQRAWKKLLKSDNAERASRETWTVPNWPPNSPATPSEEVILTTEATTYNPTECPPVRPAEKDTQIEWKVISLTFICLVIVLFIALVILWATMPTATEAATLTSTKASEADFSLPRPFLN